MERNDKDKISWSERKVMSRNKYGYGLGVFISVGFGQLMIEFLGAAFGARFIHYYQTVVHFDFDWFTIAMIIYAIYNMFNDPIVGYLSDKPRKWWSKWGKRKLWIIGGGLPWALCFILLFSVPESFGDGKNVPILFWLLLSLFLYDTLFSIYDTTYNSLIPDKFRSNNSRLRQSSWAVLLGLIGSVLGAMIPPMLIGEYDARGNYPVMAAFVAGVGIISLLIQVPGIKETPEMIERALMITQEEKEPFFRVLWKAVKQRSFLAYLLIYLCYQTCSILMIGSIAYVNDFIIDGGPSGETLIMSGYIITGLLCIPVWSIIAKKIGNKKVFLIGGLCIVLFAIPLLFVSEMIWVIISVALLGIGYNGFWVMMLPVLSDAIDEASVRNKKRQEGLYMGVRTFFGRIAIILQVLTFNIVQRLTDFDQYADVQIGNAQFGIRIIVAIVPIGIMALGIILFYILYDITPEKKERIQEQLKELNL